MSEYYFAYGANVDLEKLHERGVYPSKPGVLGQLMNHRINFNKRAKGKKMGWADIEEKMFWTVCGVLWRITEEDLETLDRIEVGYDRVWKKIATLDGIKEAHVYQAQPSEIDYPRWPGRKYVRRIIKAGRKYGFLNDYMEILRRFEEKAWRPLE